MRRAAAGPTRPATGCGRRPSSQTAVASGLGVLGGSGCEGRVPGAVSDRPLAAPGPARPARRRPTPGCRSQGLRPGLRQLAPGGALPDPGVAEVHLYESLLHFSEPSGSERLPAPDPP